MVPLFPVERDWLINYFCNELEFLIFVRFLHGGLVSLVDIVMILQALSWFKDWVKVEMVNFIAPKLISHNLNRIELLVWMEIVILWDHHIAADSGVFVH